MNCLPATDLAVGLVDPATYYPFEGWIASSGPDAFGAGEDPTAVISTAIAALDSQRIASSS
jgi:hypothetical protein